MSDNSNIRPIAFEDRKYVLQSYLYDTQKSPMFTTARGEPAPGLISDDYFGYQHKLIEDFLPRSVKRNAAYICCEPGGNHLYRGYLIAEPFADLPVVHFLKVKNGAQRQGVATALLNRFYADFGYEKGKQNLVYTHLTHDLHRKKWVQDWARSWSCVYLPWFVFCAAEADWDK
jgi:GNAT superfamily N-acetyltransferase